MEESSPIYLFNVPIEGNIQVKTTPRLLSVTGGQGNAIQSKYLIRQHISKITIASAEYNSLYVI